ncbi:sigma-54 dependent transcriptional regulator [Paraburkholderia sp. A1RI_3L]|uniref:sigma-54-dependent transcriptional regulator n=1 Tax=Paraburkholderia TaxID=1822464 RepID=UPI003B7613C1
MVDDEPEICALVAELLAAAGFDTLSALDGSMAISAVDRGRVDAMVTDYRLPDMTGLTLIQEAHRREPHLPVVMITGYADVRGAVVAMQAGVFDYLAKPFSNKDLVAAVRSALASQTGDTGASADRNPSLSNSLSESMGPSDAVRRLSSRIEMVAKNDFSVLILGETGTGKELVAHALHSAGARARAPFLPIDCGAIPEHLFEAELYGHEKGAFTGAAASKPGKFSAAGGGTLFLDEIANMPLASQAKLLRAIQERTVYRIGSNTAHEVDVRIVAASNEDLEKSALCGRFRSDLFFRLSEFVVHLPPLRARPEDIRYLADRFLTFANAELGKHVAGFTDAAYERLIDYRWPGNVRQLRNTVRQAALFAAEIIVPEHLDITPGSHVPANHDAHWAPLCEWAGLSLKEVVRRGVLNIERQVLEEALRQTRGNKAMAARLLHLDYKTIHTKINQYGLR